VRNDGGKGVTIPRAQDLYRITAGGAKCLLRAPRSPNIFARTCFNTVNFLPKDLRSEANFHFRIPRLFKIRGPSGSFATTDVIQISTSLQVLVTSAELFIGGFIQLFMVINCIWCALFVMSQFDVIRVSKPTFGEAC